MSFRACVSILVLAVAGFAQEGWKNLPLAGSPTDPASWRAREVKLETADDALVLRCDSAGNGFVLPRGVPFRSEVVAEATVQIQERLLRDGWNFAGVALFQDPGNFWVLGLVEGPDGKHSVDFIECLQGTWQAQNATGTALVRTGNPSYDWQKDTAYRLRLAFRNGSVEAAVMDATGTKVLANASFALGEGQAVRSGLPALVVRGSAAAVAGFQVLAPEQPTTPSGVTPMAGKLGRIALFDEPFPGADRQANQRLASVMEMAGFGVTRLSADQMVMPGVLSGGLFHILVIPNCASFPAQAGGAVQQFAREGGHVFFVGGPFLDNPLYKIDGKWLDTAAIADLMRATVIAHRPFAIEPALDLSSWQRACRDRNTDASFRVVNEGPDGMPCIRLDVAQFGGWDGRLSPALDQLYGQGDDLLLFQAKGDEKTSQLSVEIQEKDGSRWIATARIGTQWQRVVLPLSDFHYWHDSPTKNTRGQASDSLNPAQAARINFGFSSTHTPAVGAGPHTAWIADLGTGKSPIASPVNQGTTLNGSIPTIYPRYKVHPLAGPAQLGKWTKDLHCGNFPLASTSLGNPGNLVCGIPRTLGTGFDRDHKWRFVPVTQAKTDTAEGFCEWFTLNQDMPFDGVVFAGFGYTEPQQWRDSAFLNRVVAVAKLVREGVVFEEAGTEHLAYWPGETVRLGVRLRVFAGDQPTGRVDCEILQNGQRIWHEQVAQPLPNGRVEFAFSWQPPEAPGVYTFRARLLDPGSSPRFHDAIEHEFAVLDPAPAARSEFVRAHDGDFWLKGEKWYPVGINYWPLYVSGMDHDDYWAGWLRDRYYEPTLVEQDLVQMADMGINMVSIQSPPLEHYRNLLDFARRCANHGIHINLYVGQASPLAFNDAGLKEYLEATRLPGNATVFAYDTIWEPGNHVFKDDAARGKWDAEWRAWIDERYGSLANAERDWQFGARRNAQDEVISPSNEQFRNDGPWRIQMAAYRRFMDDLTSRLWGQANRRLRELDPNHLVSFRQGNTLPHDFALSGPVKHLDFICPEGYAVPNTDDGENAIGFITRYVGYTTGGKPIIWSEFGSSVWDGQRIAPNATAIVSQGSYHARFYRTGLAAGANGTAPWWWPGGYRVGERSDYGVVEPSHAERPAAQLIREYASQFKTARPKPVPTAWLDYDRDAHAGGYWWTAFNDGAAAYRAAADQGQTLGIRTAGTGTDSTTTPLVAVGGVPCTGQNPPRYLDAEFNHLQILAADGTWVEAKDGVQITVQAGQPVRARASLGNLQEATWTVPGHASGGVALVVRMAGEEVGKTPIANPVSYLGDADFGEFTLIPSATGETNLSVRLEALGRTPFGEARTFTLKP